MCIPVPSFRLRSRLTAGDSNEVQLSEVATGKKLEPLRGGTGWMRSCAFSPDGKMLACGGLDDLVHLFDLATHKEIAKLTGHQRRIHFVAFSHDGKLLATAGMDRAVMIWDAPEDVMPKTSKAAAPAAPENESRRMGIRSACAAEIERLCRDASGLGRCLRQYTDELSAVCKAVLNAVLEERRSQ